MNTVGKVYINRDRDGTLTMTCDNEPFGEIGHFSVRQVGGRLLVSVYFEASDIIIDTKADGAYCGRPTVPTTEPKG